jgi:hypothetical protein
MRRSAPRRDATPVAGSGPAGVAVLIVDIRVPVREAGRV